MNAEIIEKIEDFLEGRISRDELEQAAEAAGVTDLEEEIRWMQDSRTAIEASGLRDQLTDLLPETRREEAKVRKLKPLRTILAVAASVLFIVVAYWMFDTNNQSGPYARYDYVDPGLPVLMSQSEDYLLYDALTYYGEKNYQASAEKLMQIRDQYPNSDTLYYYLGASQLYRGKTEAAKEALRKVLELEDSGYRQRAEWLLVLSALKENDEQAAEDHLANILNSPGHEFYEQAESLQKELN